MIKAGSLRKQMARTSAGSLAAPGAVILLSSDAYWNFAQDQSLVSRIGGVTLTNARNSVGTFRGTNRLVQTATTNVARYHCDNGGNVLGLLNEVSPRTNILLHNRDLANVVWAKTDTTPAKDQVGVDGAVDSASSLTADADGGTASQSIASASAIRILSFDLKRLIGTGTIEISVNNSTFADVTADVDNAALKDVNGYVRVFQGLAAITNPVVVIRLGTSGDKIAVDFGQVETGEAANAAPTSRIETGASGVTRASETCAVSITGYDTAASMYARTYVRNAALLAVKVQLDDAGNTNRHTLFYNSDDTVRGATLVSNAEQANINAGATVVDAFSRLAYGAQQNSFAASLNGAAVVTDAAGNMPAVTTVRVGALAASTLFGLNGVISDLALFKRRLTNAELQVVTA